jgi:hypothetical protein
MLVLIGYSTEEGTGGDGLRLEAEPNAWDLTDLTGLTLLYFLVTCGYVRVYVIPYGLTHPGVVLINILGRGLSNIHTHT